MTIALDLFFAGEAKLQADHEAKEHTKLGVLRGGSAGCLLEDNTTIGCPHEALARYMGYSLDKTLSQGYFDSGVDNEQIWERNLLAAIPTDAFSAMKREEEIPISYQLDGKHLITGRPDVVLGDQSFSPNKTSHFTPKRGVELKGCYALDTGADRLYGMRPDAKHVCQAGFYMHAMGIPWSIVYSINVTGDMSFFRKKDYGEQKLPLGKVEFPLEIRGGRIHYQHPETGTWLPTIITVDGILNYYRLIVDMHETKQVGLTSLAGVTVLGDDLPWDPNLYHTFTDMVPVNQGWDVFEEYCQRLKTADKFIKYSKGKYLVCQALEPKGPRYIAQPRIIGKYDSLISARKVVYEGFK